MAAHGLSRCCTSLSGSSRTSGVCLGMPGGEGQAGFLCQHLAVCCTSRVAAGGSLYLSYGCVALPGKRSGDSVPARCFHPVAGDSMHALARRPSHKPSPKHARGGNAHAPVKKHCNCKNSRCLKLYCECFASGRYCDGWVMLCLHYLLCSCICLESRRCKELKSCEQAATLACGCLGTPCYSGGCTPGTRLPVWLLRVTAQRVTGKGPA